VRLEVGSHTLRLDVVDDGAGVRPGSSSGGTGLGLSSMRLRAEELGGTFALDSSQDGTRVHVELPR
jgi:signal transduction histidine kinase